MKSLFVSFNVRLLDDLHGASMGFKWGHESGYWDEYSRNMLFYSHGDLFHTYILAFGWHSIFDDAFRVRLPWSGCLGWICMRRARPGLKCEHFLSFWWLVVDPALPCPAPYRSDVWLLWRLAAVTFVVHYTSELWNDVLEKTAGDGSATSVIQWRWSYIQ